MLCLYNARKERQQKSVEGISLKYQLAQCILPHYWKIFAERYEKILLSFIFRADAHLDFQNFDLALQDAKIAIKLKPNELTV